MSFVLGGFLKGAGEGISENAERIKQAGLLRYKQYAARAKLEEQRTYDEAQAARKGQALVEAVPGINPSLAKLDPAMAAQAYKMNQPKDATTSKMKEYRMARDQGYTGSFLDYQTEIKKSGATNVTTNVGGNAFEKGMAKYQAELFGTLHDGGLKAGRDLAMIDRLEGLFRQFESGGGAVIKQFAGEFGIESEGLDEIQTAQAIINKMVPEQRPPGTGPMSDADLALFKQSLPRIINQPGGNALIIDTLRGLALYQQEQGKIAQQVMTGMLSREQALDALSGLANPLDRFNQALGQSGKDRSSSIRQKYGLED